MSRLAIEDAREPKHIKIYRQSMEDFKDRLIFLEGRVGDLSTKFDIETCALQIRKLIELLAFSLMTVHRQQYVIARTTKEQTPDDWNAPRIMNDIELINKDFYPLALKRGFEVMPDGTKMHVQRKKEETLNKKQLTKLYERCGGVLHAESPWKGGGRIDAFGRDLPQFTRKLRASFESHGVLVNHGESSTAIVMNLNDEGTHPEIFVAHGVGNFKRVSRH